MSDDFADDIAAVGRIRAVPSILDVVCRTTGMGFAAVARVTEDRWVACSVKDEIGFGLVPGGELKVETTICNEIRGSGERVVIDHVAEHPHFARHHTPAMYGFQSYISVPIRLKDGTFFGTLCAIDPNPAKLDTPETIATFELFAELIASHLEAELEHIRTSATLASERHESELREQFVAVLGHDLRNPLASIEAGARMLAKMPLETDARTIVALMQGSTRRMAGLIDDVMDFARVRLGDGIALRPSRHEQPGEILAQVIDEIRSAHPQHAIDAQLSIDRPITADHARLGQLLSNLLANAVAHGRKGGTIRVQAACERDTLVLSVANDGEPIAPQIVADMFKPFVRAQRREDQQGLGLGLYIASAIAQAHGGTLDVRSDATETVFTLRMPWRCD